MSEIFIVKLDLSTITHDENERFYILLVDPKKMKIIYQFKMWVRFLFSINFSFKFVYEDSVIHDLEDITILKILKTVQVCQAAGYAAGERQQEEELMANLNKYDEWRKMADASLLGSRKPYNLMNIDNSETSNMQSSTPRALNFENSKLDLSDVACRSVEAHGKNFGKPPQHSSYDSSQSLNGVIEKRNQQIEVNCNIFQTDEINASDYYHNKNKGKESLQNYNSFEGTGNNPRSKDKFDKCNKTNEESTANKPTVKRSVHKPFCLYDFLRALRCQESNIDGRDQVKCGAGKECHKKEVPTGICKNEKGGKEECSAKKKKKKRNVKHKNKKKKAKGKTEQPNQTVTQLQHNEKLKAASVNRQKAKAACITKKKQRQYQTKKLKPTKKN